MRRTMAIAALGVTATILSGAPASAALPEAAAFTFPSSACGFPVLVSVTGKSKVIQHGDRLITTGPAQRATLTNVNTTKTISINIAGAFHETVLPNGDLVGKGTGHNVFFGPNIEGIVYSTGPISYIQDAETGVVTITGSAKFVNLCDALA